MERDCSQPTLGAASAPSAWSGDWERGTGRRAAEPKRLSLGLLRAPGRGGKELVVENKSGWGKLLRPPAESLSCGGQEAGVAGDAQRPESRSRHLWDILLDGLVLQM